MKPQVLITTTSASVASLTTCRPSSTTWPSSTSESTRLRAQPRLIRETRIASFTAPRAACKGSCAAERSPAARAGSRRLLLDDPDLDHRLDRRVQLDRDVVDADLLQRLVELHGLVVDRDALLAQRRGDLRRRHRAEQVTFGVRAALDRDRGLAELLRELLHAGDALLLLDQRERAGALDLREVRLRHRHGEPARQQVVARVAGLDLHHVADATEVLDVLLQQEFHLSHPPDERHQADEARALDRFGQQTLVLAREAGALARLDAAVGRHELGEVRDVLVVQRLLGQHQAALLPEPAELAASAAVAPAAATA